MGSNEIELEFICPKPASELRDDGATLYCDTCDHDVLMLSRMTATAAGAVLEATGAGAHACVAYARDADGVVFWTQFEQQLAGAAALVAAAALVVSVLPPPLETPPPDDQRVEHVQPVFAADPSPPLVINEAQVELDPHATVAEPLYEPRDLEVIQGKRVIRKRKVKRPKPTDSIEIIPAE